MAIGVSGSFYFQFSAGEAEDFLDAGQLEHFKLIEKAGNRLPEWEVLFNVSDEEVLRFLNEGNDLEVVFGADPSTAMETALVVRRLQTKQAGEQLETVYANGTFSAMSYAAGSRRRILSRQSGVEAIRSVVEEHFEVPDGSFNIERSDDRQFWVQANVSDRRFVSDVWMHSFLPDSFLATGITADGRFLLKDVRQLVGMEPSWVLTDSEAGEDAVSGRTIIFDPDRSTTVSSGLINDWIGRGRRKVVYDIEEGLSADLSVEPEQLIALTSNLMRRAGIEQRQGEASAINDNVHPEYWRAYLRNLTNLALHSMTRVMVSFTGRFFPLEVLQPVMVVTSSAGGPSRSEFSYGVFLIGSVTREVTGNVLTTTLELFRESPNRVQGDFRPVDDTVFIPT